LQKFFPKRQETLLTVKVASKNNGEIYYEKHEKDNIGIPDGHFHGRHCQCCHGDGIE
jgi:hypothetical protein